MKKRMNKQRRTQPLNLNAYQNQSKKKFSDKRFANKLHKNVLIFAVCAIALIVFGVYAAGDEHTAQYRFKTLNSELFHTEDHNASLTKGVTKPKYVVTASGHMDYASARTIQKIKDVFSTCNNWKNGHQYADARQEASHYIKDRSFFKGNASSKHRGFMWPRVDSSGDSTIDAIGIKRLNDHTEVYEISPGKFLVITHYYDYFDQKALSQKNAMSTKQRAFIFYGHQQSIDRIQPLNNLDNSK